ncbi:MFS transporter [Nonomuraea zeae]|uniref:MFS transporter n=1 Tax=Nonomuraea zeae TaxID=1642303 RepID=A0A5S4GK41_9ACTN|nr:MFS transporter [Nonomuraea zeae]TMR33295.1 MFS transporter [Nonomuraea zeae]
MTEAPPALRGNRDFRRLLLAGVISQTGDWAVGTGLAFYVYDLTGSTLSSAITLLVSRLPDVVLGSVAGVLADRWDRRRLLVGTDLLLAAGLLPLLLVRQPAQMWIVYAVALWAGVLSTLLAPAQKSLVPQLVAGSQLVRANALHGQCGEVARLAGAMAGGVAVSAGGLSAVVLLGVAGFAISAALQASLRVPGRPAPMTTVGGQWIDGLRLAARDPGLRLLVAFMMITGLGEGIFGTLAAPFVADVLGGGGDAYGLFMSVQAIGGIAGGLVVAAYPGRAAPGLLLGCATIAFGLLDLALFTYPLAVPAFWPALVLIGLAGVPGAAMTAAFTTLAQRVGGEERGGSVFGLLGSAHATTALLGTLLAGVLAGVLGHALGGSAGIVGTLCVHAGGLLIAGLMALTLMRRPRG